MKVHVKHTLKTDVAAAFKLCTEQKSQEQVYAKLGGSDLRIKREGRAPNVQLRISRRMPANPPAAIRRLVPSTNEVSHVEKWSADGDAHAADIVVEIKGVPVKITGSKVLRPEKAGCSVEWNPHPYASDMARVTQSRIVKIDMVGMMHKRFNVNCGIA